MGLLNGKRDLAVEIANEHSITADCAIASCAAGAELALTYGCEKSALFIAPLGVNISEQRQNIFKVFDHEWGQFDFIRPTIAYCRKDEVQGRVLINHNTVGRPS